MSLLIEIENEIGFPIKRIESTDKTLSPYDETFSFKLFQKYYRKENELQALIEKTTRLLFVLEKEPNKDTRLIAYCFSLLGNMHYILKDFNKSIGCFMKSLSYNREDLTNWIELMFALRAHGNFMEFEGIIFNLEKIYSLWLQDPERELKKEKIYELISNAR